MSGRPLLSVITITYNEPQGLKETIESLAPLAQSSVSWEHVIIDSSPEKNEGVFKSLSGWPLNRVSSSPKGIYPAFNLGVEQAKGELVWFLNGGDRLKNVENLEKVLRFFREDPTLDIACAGVDIFREKEFTYSGVPASNFLSNLLGQNSLCHQGMIYRRSVFDRVGQFNDKYKLAGDYDHHFRCYCMKMNFLTSKIIIAEFDRGGQSDNFKAAFKEFREIWRNYRSQLPMKVNVENEVLGLGHYAKIAAMKSAFLKPISTPLKSIWYRLHRAQRS